MLPSNSSNGDIDSNSPVDPTRNERAASSDDGHVERATKTFLAKLKVLTRLGQEPKKIDDRPGPKVCECVDGGMYLPRPEDENFFKGKAWLELASMGENDRDPGLVWVPLPGTKPKKNLGEPDKSLPKPKR